MKLIGKLSHYDRIIAYLTDESAETELTEHEQELLKRWNEAFTLQRNNTTADAAAILQKRFPGISRATAYRDCANALSLFGDSNKSTKEGIRHLTKEMVMEAYKIARAKNNETGMIRAALAIAKVTGINDNDPDMPDFSALEPHTFELGLDAQTLNALKTMITGGMIDLSTLVKVMQETAVDAEFTEVPNEIEPGEHQ